MVLGDLTWNIENKLACPQNLIGKIDVYQTTHHGEDASGAPQHVWAVAPKVAIMTNGSHHGGTPPFYATLKKSPGMNDIWQMHRKLEGENTDERMIANLTEEVEQDPQHQLPTKCEAHWIKLTVTPDGSKYTVYNSRNQYSKSYVSK